MRTAIASVLTVVCAVGCTSKPEAPTNSGEPAAHRVTDRDRLQGVWAVESIDDGFQGPSDSQKEGRVQFQGDQVLFTLAKDDTGERFTFALDPSKSPKWIALIQDSPEPNPGEKKKDQVIEECIYQLEGDALVLARSPTLGKRPTEFKARPGLVGKLGQPAATPVALWRLKRTTEPYFQPKAGSAPTRANSKFTPVPQGTSR